MWPKRRKSCYLLSYFLFLFCLISKTSIVSADPKRRNRQELKDKTNKELREKSLKEAKKKANVFGAAGEPPTADPTPTTRPDSSTTSTSSAAKESIIISAASSSQFSPSSYSALEQSASDEPSYSCPSAKDPLRFATDSFWKHELLLAYSCASSVIETRAGDGLAQAIRYAVSQSKYADFLSTGKIIPAPKIEPQEVLLWDILGPFPCNLNLLPLPPSSIVAADLTISLGGKLELDADPAIATYRLFLNGQHPARLEDIAQAVLTMPTSLTFHTELQINGQTSWKSAVKPQKNGMVEVKWSANWNELVNGISSTSVYEFQGWSRAVTFVRTGGMYVVNCLGVHTIYLRNANTTRVLVGDIYMSQRVTASVELKPGPVGLVLPLRGAGQMSFHCSVRRAERGLEVAAPIHVPDLLELPRRTWAGARYPKDEGMLISNNFALQITNTMRQPLRLTFSLETPRGLSISFRVQPVRGRNDPLCDSYLRSLESSIPPGLRCKEDSLIERYDDHFESIEVAPGQMTLLPMEIIPTDVDVSSSSSAWNATTLPCRRGLTFMITITPSPKGEPVTVPLEFGCRKARESVVFSFIDHDGSVSQAAWVFPLSSSILSPEQPYDPNPDTQQKVAGCVSRAGDTTDCPSGLMAEGYEDEQEDETLPDPYPPEDPRSINWHDTTSSSSSGVNSNDYFPVLLSLHGTGISHRSQADAYKVKQDNKPVGEDFKFGVEGFWVVAPDRHGAHNWEGVGEMTARRSVFALKEIMSRYSDLPQIIDANGIIAGHSMGGHGALLTATLNPDTAVCASITAGWIRKEEYGNANAFFDLDVQNSYIEPGLKHILESSMSAHHPDKLIHNMLGMDVHIRVGSNDMTTHPWYSRRLHRLLSAIGVNSSLEEVNNRQHWWWDTKTENDGGVLNDKKMRSFYEHCRTKQHGVSELKSISEKQEKRQPIDHCTKDFEAIVTDVASQNSRCGISVLQQFDPMKKSTFSQRCYILSKSLLAFDADHLQGNFVYENVKASISDLDKNETGSIKVCELFSKNVKRLRLLLPFSTGSSHLHVERPISVVKKEQAKSSRFYVSLKVNGHDLKFRIPKFNKTRDDTNIGFFGSKDAQVGRYSYDKHGVGYVDICFSSDNVEICPSAMDILTEKTPLSSGPLRQIYAHPLVIVYGTPLNSELRSSMRDLATYLANQIAISQNTYVRIASDLEYFSEVTELKQDGSTHRLYYNLMLIGGPKTNKFTKRLVSKDESLFSILHANIPVTFSLPDRHSRLGSLDDSVEEICFDRTKFNNPSDATIFTFPIAYALDNKIVAVQSRHSNWLKERTARLGVVITANSANAYLHISRMASPTVPPMVRAAFSNYIPDFMVFDNRIWDKGFGSVKLAGFWNSNWKYSPELAYNLE